MAVTAKDVAASLGVSLSTVSRALADSPRVAPDTRRRVRAAADRMGYRPNLAARSLMTGRHGVIGVVIPDLGNPFFATICKGIQQRALAADHMVFTADTDEDVEAEAEIMASLAARVDGVILCSPRSDDDHILKMADRVPVVLVGRHVPGVASVTFDDRRAMLALLRHLIALGHRSIAYAGGPEHSWSDRVREAAFRQFADDDNRTEVSLTALGSFPPQLSGGREAADIAVSAGASAIVAYNDLMALGIMDRLRGRDVDVPGEVSVAGFDDIPAATIARPNLTTVRLPCFKAGRLSVDLLFGRLAGTSGQAEGTAADGPAVLPGEIVVRQSTAPAPAPGPRSMRGGDALDGAGVDRGAFGDAEE
jgi:DNA-binding LacI/PurR family transcriptional regulator